MGLSAGGEGTTHAGARYLEHLSEADLLLLAQACRLDESNRESVLRRLRSTPTLVERALSDPRAFDLLFSTRRSNDPLLVASPFLVFAVGVHRAAAELASATFVSDWVAPRQRLPVLDASRLREFVSDPRHRLFLAELLASYTRVASGALWVQARTGWRRQRFSELDPVRFAALVDLVSEEERPGVYRRLGDLALFLTGVFPDHSSTNLFGRFDLARLMRATTPGDRPRPREGELGAIGLLEELGERWYRIACATAPPPTTTNIEIVASVAERFRDARRVLNFVTDRYLWGQRARWFPGVN
jgi:hypothetical protein